MAWHGNQPKFVTWLICLVLFVIALIGHFNVIQIRGDIVNWSWIIGFGLLLLAVRVKGL